MEKLSAGHGKQEEMVLCYIKNTIIVKLERDNVPLTYRVEYINVWKN